MSDVAGSRLLRSTLPFLLLLGCDPATSARDVGPAEIQVDEPVHVVADDDLAQIMDIRPDAGGRIWVLSAHPPFVRVYDDGGARLAAFGQPGGGPDEFDLARSLVPPGGDREGMGVLDSGRARILQFDVRGEVLGRTRVEAQLALRHEARSAFFGDLATAWRAGGGIVQDVLPQRMLGGLGPWEFWRAELVFTGEGGETRTVTHLAQVAGVELPLPDAPPQPRILAAGPLIDVCPSGEILIHTGAQGELVRLGLDGSELARSALDLPLPANSVETMVTWLTNVSETLDPGPMDTREALRERSRMVAEMSEPFMEERVPPTNLRCDSEGRAWIQLFDLDHEPRGYAREWVVVGTEGAVLAHVSFPAGFSPLHFGAERITGILRDEFGLEVAGWVATPSVP